MARSIEDIIRNAISTGDFTPSAGAGILSNEQARKFIQQTFEATTLGNLVRHGNAHRQGWRDRQDRHRFPYPA